MNKLHGKRALVTAGAQGIGLAISRTLLNSGCDVFVHYFSSADSAHSLAKDAGRLGRRCSASAGDLTAPEECKRIVDEATNFLGGLDVLVNNAGSLVARRGFENADEDYWLQVMSLNLGSTRRVTRSAIPHLISAAKSSGGASIVNLSSLAARSGGGSGAVAYATAKGALLTFTRGLARELAPSGVRVNAVLPGLILGSSFHATHTPAEARCAMIAAIPLGRAGGVNDVARAVNFLASEFDGFITGAALDVNGGVWGA